MPYLRPQLSLHLEVYIPRNQLNILRCVFLKNIIEFIEPMEIFHEVIYVDL